MFRRTARRFKYNATNSNQRDSDRMGREATHRTMYDSHGNINPAGYAKVLWIEFGPLIKIVTGVIVGWYFFDKALIYTLRSENEGKKQIAEKIEEELREHPGYRGDRFISRPARIIEDPDFYRIPAHAISAETDPELARKFRPRLFDDDTVSSGRLHDESRGQM